MKHYRELKYMRRTRSFFMVRDNCDVLRRGEIKWKKE